MSKQKKYDVVTENEIGYLKAGDYFIPVIELKPIEVNRLGKYGHSKKKKKIPGTAKKDEKQQC